MQKVESDGVPRVSIESKKLLSENEPNPLITKNPSNGKVSTKSRTILWLITFWGFVINYMVRCNLNMAIVSMVLPRKASNNSTIVSLECFNYTSDLLLSNNTEQYQSKNEAKKHRSVERRIMDFFKIHYNENGFQWSEYEQGQGLGSFYWFFWSTPFLGGYLAKRYGTKLVFGLSNFLACGISFLIPIAAYLNFNLFLFVRMMQGILSGFSWPAMYDIISQWIPPNERSRFISAYMGGSVGIAIFYPIFGFIITILSWEWIFHFSTISAIIWFIFWQYCVYDSPEQHPRIDSSELNYITEALGNSVEKDKNAAIPWKSILTSFPYWIVVVAYWGSIWLLFTLMIQSPTYFKFIHGFDFRMSGILSGAPHLLRMGFSYIFSAYIDYLIQSKTLTTSNARKFSVFVTCIVGGAFSIGLAYSGCNSVMAIVFASLSVIMLGAQASGILSTIVDLSPNYSSILMGICLTICVLPGTFSSYIVGVLTNNMQTSQQWQYVFFIASGMSIICGMVFIFFGSSEEQKWNKSSNTVEMTPLNELQSNRT